jgi:hypothetical protein
MMAVAKECNPEKGSPVFAGKYYCGKENNRALEKEGPLKAYYTGPS